MSSLAKRALNKQIDILGQWDGYQMILTHSKSQDSVLQLHVEAKLECTILRILPFPEILLMCMNISSQNLVPDLRWSWNSEMPLVVLNYIGYPGS